MANGILLPPGLRGYVAAEQMAQQRAANQLNQIQGVLGLQQVLRQQQAAEEQQAAIANLTPQITDPAARMLAQVGDFRGAIARQFPTNENLVVPPGAAVVPKNNPGATPLFTNPRETPESDLARYQRERSMLPPGHPGIADYDAKIAKLVSHAPAPNVNVKVDTKTGESFAKEIGPMMTDSRSSALSALSAVETAQRIGGAISQGNVTLGPTATLRNKTDQIAQLLGVGGASTEERLVNTRNVIRGLSQFTIAARKQLKGQGQVSDYEGKLLQRAESGEIEDFTLPELKDFIGVTDKLARQTYGEHQRMLGVMKGDPRISGFVPFYSVPDLPNPGKTVKRTGTYQGKKVIEYSDGTIETQ